MQSNRIEKLLYALVLFLPLVAFLFVASNPSMTGFLTHETTAFGTSLLQVQHVYQSQPLVVNQDPFTIEQGEQTYRYPIRSNFTINSLDINAFVAGHGRVHLYLENENGTRDIYDHVIIGNDANSSSSLITGMASLVLPDMNLTIPEIHEQEQNRTNYWPKHYPNTHPIKNIVVDINSSTNTSEQNETREGTENTITEQQFRNQNTITKELDAVCGDACSGMEENNLTLVIKLSGNTKLYLSSIHYRYEVEVQQNKDIPNYYINKNQLSRIDLAPFFNDSEDLVFDVPEREDLNLTIKHHYLDILANQTGNYSLYLYILKDGATARTNNFILSVGERGGENSTVLQGLHETDVGVADNLEELLELEPERFAEHIGITSQDLGKIDPSVLQTIAQGKTVRVLLKTDREPSFIVVNETPDNVQNNTGGNDTSSSETSFGTQSTENPMMIGGSAITTSFVFPESVRKKQTIEKISAQKLNVMQREFVKTHKNKIFLVRQQFKNELLSEDNNTNNGSGTSFGIQNSENTSNTILNSSNQTINQTLNHPINYSINKTINQTTQQQFNQTELLPVEQISNDYISLELSQENIKDLFSKVDVGEIILDKIAGVATQDALNITRTTEAQQTFNLSGQGTKICILDTGLNPNAIGMPVQHVFGYNFVNDTTNYTDDNGHGTSVTYIAYQTAPNAEYYIGKVLDNNGQGYSSNIIAGLDWCKDNNATIVSLSLGEGSYQGYCDNQAVAQKVNELSDEGTLVVVASGNDGNNDAIMNPACASKALAVASSTKQDTLSSFSNTNGKTLLLAPGENIETKDKTGATVTLSGTSLSTPIIAGAGALYQEQKLNQTGSFEEPQNILWNIIHTGDIVTTSRGNFSRLNTYNLLTGMVTNNLSYTIIGNSSNSTGVFTTQTTVTITNCTGLQNMKNNLTGNYILGNDIDCSDTKNWNGGAGFIPIGWDTSNRFNGTFNGHQYVIKDFYQNRSNIYNVSLFGLCYEGADISNFSMVNYTIYTRNSAAGSNYGAAVATHFLGIMDHVGTIGYLGATSNARYESGLVGYLGGNVSTSFSTGYINNNYQGTGGLIGATWDNSASAYLKNSFTLAKVSGPSGYVGGAIGRLADTAQYTYAASEIPTPSANIDGFIGDLLTGYSVSNNYYDSDVSGDSSGNGATAETTSQMKTQSTFSGWDFTNTWFMDSDWYPMLKGFASITSTVFNATSSSDYTTDNLTLTIQSTSRDGLLNITDWRLNGTSIAKINYPLEDVLDTYSGDRVKDYSTFENTGSLGGGVSSDQPTLVTGKVGKARDFDGTNDYIVAKDATNLSGGASFEAWIKPDDVSTSRYIISNFDGNNSVATDRNGFIFRLKATGALVLAYSTSDTDYFARYTNNYILSTGNWYHVVGVWNSTLGPSGLKIYVNGVRKDTTDLTSGTVSSYDESDQPFLVGVKNGSTGLDKYFDGVIDEVRIYNRVLSEDQINISYNAGTSGTYPKTIVSNETSVNDKWSVKVVPNNYYFDGDPWQSSNITIQNIITYNVTQAIIQPSSPNSTDDLLGNCTGTSSDGSSFSQFNWTWYLNGNEYSTGSSTGTFTNGTSYNVANISSSLTSPGNAWILSCMAIEGSENSSWTNSSSVSVSNLAPNSGYSILTPNNTALDEEDLFGYCNYTDPDGDDLWYYYTWYLNGVENSSGYVPQNFETNFDMNSNYDVIRDMITDQYNNLYTVGYGTDSNADWWIKKFDQEFVEDTTNWNQTLGGANTDAAKAIDINSQGYIFISGTLYSTTTSSVHWRLEKFNSTGYRYTSAQGWDIDYDTGDPKADLTDEVIDSNDNLYVVGYASNLVSGTSVQDWWIKKINSTGSEDATNWNKTFDRGSEANYAYGIAVDSGDNVYVVGGDGDWWIKKFSSSGTEDTTNWNKTVDGGSGTDRAESIAVDSNDNIYVVGYGTNLISGTSGNDWWIKKYSSSGVEDTSWNKTFDGGTGDDRALVVKIDSNDDVYVGGFGTDLVSGGSTNDWWIKRFTSSGQEYTTAEGWNISYDGYGDTDKLRAIAINENNEIYLGGTKTGVVHLGTSSADYSLGNATKGFPSGFSALVDYIPNSTTSPGDNWTLECLAFDGIDNATYASNDSTLIEGSPTMQTVTISPSPTAWDNETLEGWCNASDPIDTDLTYYWEWYVDGVLNLTGDTSPTTYTSNLLVNPSNITSGNLTAGQNWTFSCMAGNGDYNSSWMNSSNTTINSSNIAPVTVSASISPSPDAYDYETLEGYCNGTDADGNTLYYNWTWYNNSVEYSSGQTSSSYTQGVSVNVANISSSLLNSGDNWTIECLAYDGTDYASSSVNSSNTTILSSNTCDPSNPNSFSGSGTTNDPYLIYDCCQLQAMNTSLSSSYKIMNNINCTNTNTWNGGLGFKPVGQASPYFTGSLNGQNYIIDDLFVNATLEKAGLFGQLASSASLINIKFTDAHIETTGNYAGTLFGVTTSSSASAENISVDTSYVKGNTDTGGVIGQSYASLTNITITNSDIDATNQNAGGVIGLLSYGSLSTVSASTLSINSTNVYVGGLVGQSAISMSNIDITDITVEGVGQLGGFIGYTTGGTINHCSVNGGTIKNHGYVNYIGGFVGNLGGSTFINDSWVNLTLQHDAGGSYLGGFVGTAGASTIINNSISYSIFDTSGSTNNYCGGFVGYSQGVIDNGTVNPSTGKVNFSDDYYVGGFVGRYYTGSSITNSQISYSKVIGKYVVGGFAGFDYVSISDLTLPTLTVEGETYVSLFIGELSNPAVLTNISVNGTVNATSSNGGSIAGLVLDGASIKNTSISGPHIYGGSTLGGLVGSLRGEITDSSFTGNLSGTGNTGGLVGVVDTTAVVNDSSSNVDISETSASNYLGGFTGQNKGEIYRCSASGTLQATSYIGGFSGSNTNIIENSSSDMTISSSGSRIGGFVGLSTGNISYSNSTGSLTTTGSATAIGGFVGETSAGVIDFSRSNLVVNHTGTGNGKIGGFVGSQTATIITNSVALKDVYGYSGVGGFAGIVYAGSSLTNDTSYGDVFGTSYNLGGFVGIAYENLSSLSIQNIRVNGDGTNSLYVGGFVGQLSSSTLKNISVQNITIDGNPAYAGSIVGYATHSVINDSTVSDSTVEGTNTAGGLVGWLSASNTSNSSVTGTTVVTTGDNSGGFVGNANGVSTIRNCSSKNVVVNGTNHVAGFAGTSSEAWINNSLAKNVTVTASDSFAGGFTGGFGTNSVFYTINNSYASGTVTAYTSSAGFVGNYYNNGYIYNSYSATTVTCTASHPNCNAFAYLSSLGGNCYYSFFDNNLTQLSSGCQATGKNTPYMKHHDQYLNAGWDIDCSSGTSIWGINDTFDYPCLMWQTGCTCHWYDSPDPNSVYIVPAPNATNSQDLVGYCNVSDTDSSSVSYSWIWYVNGVEFSSGSTSPTTYPVGVVQALDTLSSSSTAPGQTWTFSCNANDGLVTGSYVNSSGTLITNNAPNSGYANVTPEDTALDDEDVFGYCNYTDPDGDDLYYYYTWYVNGVENSSGLVPQTWDFPFDGALQDDEVLDVAVDQFNDIYTVGVGTDVISSSSDKDIWLKKFNYQASEDTTNWNKKFDYGTDAKAVAVVVDEANHSVYVLSQYTATNNQWLLKKFDFNGTEYTSSQGWNQTFDTGSVKGEATDLAIDSQQNIYALGKFFNSSDSHYLWEIKKFYPNGTEYTSAQGWNKSISFSDVTVGTSSLVVDSNDNLYVGGYVNNLVGGSTFQDALIKKFNSAGVEQWNRSYDMSAYDQVLSLAVDSNDNLYAGMKAYDLVSGSSNNDLWIKKFTSSGTEITSGWNKSINYQDQSDIISKVLVDSQDNLFVVASSYDLSSTSSLNDWWVKQFSSSGVENTTDWNISFNGVDNGNDYSYSAVVNANDEIYVVGEYENEVDTNSGYDWMLTNATQAYPSGLQVLVGSIPYQDTTPGDNWTLQCLAYDGVANATYASNDSTLIKGSPTMHTVSISPSPTAWDNGTLEGWCNASDPLSTNLTYYWEWYVDGVLNLTGDTSPTNYTSNLQVNPSNITSGNLSSGQNWTFSCMAGDGDYNSSWMNSSNTTINQSYTFYITYNNSFTNNTNAHSFDVTAGVYHSGTASQEVNGTSISYTNGSCSYTSNSSSGNYFNVTYTCSGTPYYFNNVSITFYDTSGNNRTTAFSGNIYPNQAPAIPTLIVPTNGNTTIHDIQPFFNWSGSDPENDPINYTINISSNVVCPALATDIINTTNVSNYTNNEDFCPNANDLYFWKVKACDAWDCSAWTSLWNFTLEPYVDIVFINASSGSTSNRTLNFGTVYTGNLYDTTNGTDPFRIRNNGNVLADLVNLTASSSLWSSSGCGLGTNYMQFRIANATGEPNSFNWTGSTINWTNLSSSNGGVIDNLNYSNANDEAIIDFNITVPNSEPSGQKSSTIWLSWEETP